MNAATLLVLDTPRAPLPLLPEAERVLSLELGGASLHAAMHGAAVSAAASVEDVAVHDLCTHGSGVSEVLLARWHAGAVPGPGIRTGLRLHMAACMSLHRRLA